MSSRKCCSEPLPDCLLQTKKLCSVHLLPLIAVLITFFFCVLLRKTVREHGTNSGTGRGETGRNRGREQDRAGARERQCLKLNKTGPYPEEVAAAKDRDKDGTDPRGP